jgi:hypothetical protein
MSPQPTTVPGPDAAGVPVVEGTDPEEDGPTEGGDEGPDEPPLDPEFELPHPASARPTMTSQTMPAETADRRCMPLVSIRTTSPS